MQRLKLISLIALITLSPLAMAMDNTNVAFFKSVNGEIKIKHGDRMYLAQAGGKLAAHDVLTSGADANAGIVFNDGTLITLGANSELEISQYEFQPDQSKYAFSLYMKKGRAIYSSGKLAKLAPDAVKLNTPKTSVGVRGTRFILTADE